MEKQRVRRVSRIISVITFLTAYILLGGASGGVTSALEIGGLGSSPEQATVTVPGSPVASGKDYATLVLQDPWDMNQYSDISQYLNGFGDYNYVRNIQVQNGTFSATAVKAAGAPFYPLFPGYIEGTKTGKIGVNFPIESAEYSCLFMAAKIQSGASIPGVGPDIMWVQGLPDVHQDPAQSSFGLQVVYPEAPNGGSGQPVHIWKVLAMDLNNPQFSAGGRPKWNSQTEWQGLRIDPTTQAGVSWDIDWIRLTDCNPVTAPITWTPNTAVNAIWLKRATGTGTTQPIRVATGVNGAAGSHNLDVQGIEPGEYTVGLGTTTTCCSQESTERLVIRPTPIVNFMAPSVYSGADYATAVGNTWDFSDAADYKNAANAAFSLDNGLLKITTDSSNQVGGIDARFDLNTAYLFSLEINLFAPELDAGQISNLLRQRFSDAGSALSSQASVVVTQASTSWYIVDGDKTYYIKREGIILNAYNASLSINPAEFRYLAVRMNTQWGRPVQDVNTGSIGRFVWTIQSLSTGLPGYKCALVSQDMPIDVGWNTYVFDLQQFFNGAAEETSPTTDGHCPPIIGDPQNPPTNIGSNPAHWMNTGSVIGLRYDPNENITCQPGVAADVPCSQYKQEIDWISLTAMDTVNAGDPYEIAVDLTGSGTLTYYYTSNQSNPKQAAVIQYQPPVIGIEKVFLPMISGNQPSTAPSSWQNFVQPTNLKTFKWDTKGVATGQYFICAEVIDGLNTATYCSKVPVRVK